ncbi:dihydrolipoyl dehydrogenase [Arthrobacter sp. FW306-07-I]|uniref:dihydrolipoyl dehydrogenase n=1 Tax=Arthrobacter sp. FW306-07-I TaxID=2879622 RepID=UPI001F0264A1|nr:dihydrolipoyl dehydrogenase [Arthrobacter sp. FW306-07-I]UKA77676.1 dihydrolipoyl dehydrogenase [Arthrobacter sp. FW306-07-I]
MNPQKFDVLVVGAGPGGYTAAIRSAQLGKRVAIVEEQHWGGVCLNIGCVPSKSLIHSAQLVQTFRNDAKEHGIQVGGEVTYDFGAAFQRSRSVADGRVKGIHYLMKKNGITEFNARGTFADANTMDLEITDGERQSISFDHAIIAVGAETRLLPGTALSEKVVTYKEQILSPILPKSVVIAGAGAIGVEFAYVMSSYGVKVTLVEFADRIVPLEDPEISKELTRRYRKLGIDIRTATKVTSVEENSTEVAVTVTNGETSDVIYAEKLLQATGFTPRVTGYGLEKTGIALTDRRAIGVDDQMRTNIPHIYAIGDVTAKLMLAHAAEAMALVAAEALAGEPTVPLDYLMMPRATYSNPQIASFGYTDNGLSPHGSEVKKTAFPFVANAKAHAVGEPSGFVKLLTDSRNGKLLGAHLIGPDVTELLPELTLARQEGLTVTQLARNIHAHPTLSEAVKEALHGAAGQSINI